MFSHLTRLATVALASLALTACGINSVPAAEENAKAKWADVQAAFQERANLIPTCRKSPCPRPSRSARRWKA
jgi:LemA protein